MDEPSAYKMTKLRSSSKKFSFTSIFKLFKSMKKIKTTFSSNYQKTEASEAQYEGQEEGIKQITAYTMKGSSFDSGFWDSASVIALKLSESRRRSSAKESEGDSFSFFNFTNPNIDEKGNWVGKDDI